MFEKVVVLFFVMPLMCFNLAC